MPLDNQSRGQGWDAQIISDIANKLGGYKAMFERFGWPERGADMMPAVQGRVAQTFGSVEAFVHCWGKGA
jgi:hypothetical protein